jgi:hypothetical protein
MSGNGTLRNFKSMLAEAALPETTVQICLRGDLVADHELAERELELAQKQAVDSLAGNGAAAIAERIEGLEAQMREHTYDFRLRALPRPAWRALVAGHEPRRGDDNEIRAEDRMGVNAETFFPAMIRACLVDPELTDDEWAQLNEALTDRQFDDLSDAAWGLNRREVDIPFSRAASRMRRTSADE